MEAKLYNSKGKSTKSVKLPEDVFGLPWNADLVHQVVVAMQANSRTPVAHTKDRSDVRGGGKKPWKQKGTGRARHGSSRSPIWTGGGVTHGPTNEKNYKKKINSKMKTKALYTVLSEKLRQGQLAFVDDLGLKEIKTKEAKNFIDAMGTISEMKGLETKKNNSLYLSVFDIDEKVKKSFNNIANTKVGDLKEINPVNILNHRYIIITNPEKSLAFLSGKTKKVEVEKKAVSKKK